MTLLGQDLVFPASQAVDARPRGRVLSTLPAIPESVASVEDAWSGGPRTVILIQDAHTNNSGQMNCARLLETLFAGTKGLSPSIYLEAGKGDESLSFLRSAAPLERRKAVAKSLLLQARLQGSEYFDLTSDREVRLVGVEDMALYARSLGLYRRVAASREKFEAYLSVLESAAEALKPSIFNPFLRAFDEKLRARRRGEISSVEYARALLGEARRLGLEPAAPHLERLDRLKSLEDGVDFARAQEEMGAALASLSAEDRAEAAESMKASPSKGPRFQRAFFAFLAEKTASSGRYPELVRYAEYLERSAFLDARAALDEEKALESRVIAALAASADEKSLLDAADAARILGQLLRLQCSPEDFAAYRARRAAYDVRLVTGFLNRKIMDARRHYDRIVPLEDGLEAALSDAEAFYALTLRRDEAFVQGMECAGDPSPVRILITGGYHAENLKSILKRRGYSYVSLVPQVLGETDLARYEKILLGQRLPAVFGAAHSANMTLRTVSSGGVEGLARSLGLGEQEARRAAREAAARLAGGIPERPKPQSALTAGPRAPRRSTGDRIVLGISILGWAGAFTALVSVIFHTPQAFGPFIPVFLEGWVISGFMLAAGMIVNSYTGRIAFLGAGIATGFLLFHGFSFDAVLAAAPVVAVSAAISFVATFLGTMTTKFAFAKDGKSSGEKIRSSFRWATAQAMSGGYLVYFVFLPFTVEHLPAGWPRAAFDLGFATFVLLLPRTLIMGAVFGESQSGLAKLLPGLLRSFLLIYPLNFLYWFAGISAGWALTGDLLTFKIFHAALLFVWMTFVANTVGKEFNPPPAAEEEKKGPAGARLASSRQPELPPLTGALRRKESRIRRMVSTLWDAPVEEYGAFKYLFSRLVTLRAAGGQTGIPGAGTLLAKLAVTHQPAAVREAMAEPMVAWWFLRHVPGSKLIGINLTLGGRELDALFWVEGHTFLPDGLYVLEIKEDSFRNLDPLLDSTLKTQGQGQFRLFQRMRREGVRVHHVMVGVGANVQSGRPRRFTHIKEENGAHFYYLRYRIDTADRGYGRSGRLTESQIRSLAVESEDALAILATAVPALRDPAVFERLREYYSPDRTRQLSRRQEKRIQAAAERDAAALRRTKSSPTLEERLEREARGWISNSSLTPFILKSSSVDAAEVLRSYMRPLAEPGGGLGPARRALQGLVRDLGPEGAWKFLLESRSLQGARLSSRFEEAPTYASYLQLTKGEKRRMRRMIAGAPRTESGYNLRKKGRDASDAAYDVYDDLSRIAPGGAALVTVGNTGTLLVRTLLAIQDSGRKPALFSSVSVPLSGAMDIHPSFRPSMDEYLAYKIDPVAVVASDKPTLLVDAIVSGDSIVNVTAALERIAAARGVAPEKLRKKLMIYSIQDEAEREDESEHRSDFLAHTSYTVHTYYLSHDFYRSIFMPENHTRDRLVRYFPPGEWPRWRELLPELERPSPNGVLTLFQAYESLKNPPQRIFGARLSALSDPRSDVHESFARFSAAAAREHRSLALSLDGRRPSVVSFRKSGPAVYVDVDGSPVLTLRAGTPAREETDEDLASGVLALKRAAERFESAATSDARPEPFEYYLHVDDLAALPVDDRPRALSIEVRALAARQERYTRIHLVARDGSLLPTIEAAAAREGGRFTTDPSAPSPGVVSIHAIHKSYFRDEADREAFFRSYPGARILAREDLAAGDGRCNVFAPGPALALADKVALVSASAGLDDARFREAYVFFRQLLLEDARDPADRARKAAEITPETFAGFLAGRLEVIRRYPLPPALRAVDFGRALRLIALTARMAAQAA